MPGLLGGLGATTMLGAGLLGGSSPFFGVNLGNAIQQTGVLQMQARKDARADEQAQLSQLVSSYKILQDQDMQNKRQAYLTGTPYSPNPLLQVHEQKLAQLLGQPYRPNTAAAANSAIPQAPQQAPMIGGPAPMSGGMSGGMGASQGQSQQPPQALPQQQTPQQQPQMSLPQLLQGAGITPQMAMVWSGTEKGTEQMMAKLQEAYGPRVVNNVLMQLQPGGGTKMLGGVVSKDTVPVMSGPNGLQAQKIGGLQQILADQAGATEGATQEAKAPFTPITVPNKDGSSSTMMLNQFMGGGRAQPGQPAALAVTQPPRQGSGASFGGTSQTPGDRSQQEDLGKFFAQTFVTTQQAGQQAAGNRQKLDRMQQLIEGINTTGATPVGMKVASLARAAGIDLDPKLPQKEAFASLSGQMALELRNPAGGAGMPGAMSDADREFLKSMTPGLAQTPDGRKLMFETKGKLIQRDEDVAQLARSYYKQNGKMDQGFYQVLADYANHHPLFPQATPQPSKASDIDALVNQYRSK